MPHNIYHLVGDTPPTPTPDLPSAVQAGQDIYDVFPEALGAGEGFFEFAATAKSDDALNDLLVAVASRDTATITQQLVADAWPSMSTDLQDFFQDFLGLRSPSDTGGGAAGRIKFPSEVEVELAQALLLQGQAGLLRPQFELDQERIFGDLEIRRFLADISQGQLDLAGDLGFGNLALDQRSLEETIRTNRNAEEEAAKDRALTAANAVAANFLAAQQLADARRLAAVSETRLLAPQVLPSGTEFIPGFGPDSAASTALSNIGLPPTILEPDPILVDPGALALPPTSEQIGPIPGQDTLTGLL